MRTENDLRSALALLEERADSYRDAEPAPEIPTGSRGHRARLVLRVLATAAAVAAIAVAVPLLGHDRAATPAAGPTPPTSAAPAPHRSPHPSPQILSAAAPASFDLRTYFFTIDRMNGFSLDGGVAFPDLQQAELDTGDGGHYDLTLNARGAFRPHRPAGAKTVSVHGRPGFYGELAALPMGVASMHPIGLAWEYLPHAWATVVSWNTDSIPLDRATLIADAVHPGTTSPLTVPVSVPQLPAGLKYSGSLCGPGGSRSGQHGYHGFDCLLNFDSTRTGPTMTIDVAGRGIGYQPAGAQIQVDGRTAYASADQVLIVGSDFEASVQQLPAQPSGQLKLTQAQLVSIARSLRFVAHVSNVTDWRDATVALAAH